MDGSTPNFICVGTMSADVPLPPLGSIGPNGGFVSVLHVTDALVSIKIFQFLTPLHPPPGADGPQRGKGHVGRHCPYTNKIWCGSVHALLRYRSVLVC